MTTELDLLAQALNTDANSVIPDDVRVASLKTLTDALVLEGCLIQDDRSGLCDADIGTDEAPLVAVGTLIGALTGVMETPGSSTCECTAGAKCGACTAKMTCNGALQTAKCTCTNGDSVCCKRYWWGKCKSSGRTGTCTSTCTSANAGTSSVAVQDAVGVAVASLLSHEERFGSRDELIQGGLPPELEAAWEGFRRGFEGLTEEEQQAHIDGFAYHLLEAAAIGVIGEQILGNSGEDVAGAWAYVLTHFATWADIHGIEPVFVATSTGASDTQELGAASP